MEQFDRALHEITAMAGLVNEKCYLNHGEGVRPPQAVDYLCQHLGDIENEWPEILLTIPVCEECAGALYEEDWLLFYCLTCNNSQWLMKSKARKYYPPWESIIFFYRCPICYEGE